ncbi:SdpI family protein [Corynebacterium anserum]|uniref:Uncharacterized protein n=1 Tax=Corynebacterium anserum TaxID=2684406 RepID=A0A7G7YQM9_9CORY|nr:SdpI family protein [Corynebacterium anserum]MBC2682498.1 hypothetical protein [Corynebacterium anserum]QNH96799.1 hypothetical protein GP473_09230 [Corynebacterium anserum]
MNILSIIVGVLGVAMLIIGVMSVTGTLPGNPVIGLRIPEVRKSQDYWITAHKIAGPAWTGSGLALMASAAIAWEATGWLWLIVGLLVIAAVFLLGLGAALAGHAMATIDAQAEKEAEAATTCCSAGASTPTSHAHDADVVTPEACASGQACGSCTLNGSCEGGGAAFDACHTTEQTHAPDQAPEHTADSHAPQAATSTPALDLDAARRAAATQDQR